MKSNNKLQYLQKLATKNQQQQQGAAKKPPQTNNLVGIGQSMGQPYVVGPRIGQKQVKHIPKNSSQSAENPTMSKIPVNKKFTQNKNNPSKSSIVVSNDYFHVNMDIKDPRFDQFEPIQMALGIFEDEIQIEQLRKLNRKKQMARRKQRFTKADKSILKNKSKDPTIKLEQVDSNYQEKKTRKWVSISEQPRIEQSPGVAKTPIESKMKLARKFKRNASDERSNVSLQIGQNPQSELTVSSAGRNPEEEELDDLNNSIISEVDSAFEDQTPAANKAGLRQNPDVSFSLPYGAQDNRENSPSKLTSIKIKNDYIKNDKAVAGSTKSYIRQKTLGWKEQINQDTSRWPFKRSPTNKSKNGDFESQGSKHKFVLKGMPQGVSRAKGFALNPKMSMNSSLNYQMDNQIDQLSVNVNQNLMFSKRGQDKSGAKNDVQSVASVITKGGTVFNPFHQKKNSNIYLAKSYSNSSSIQVGISARGHKKETPMLAGEKELGSASKTLVKFGDDLDEEFDIRKSYYKNNQKMINIYLKTPYKVLTIDQIKNKEKVDREQDLIDNANVSPSKLYIAENNLKVHTLIREKNNYATAKGKGFKNADEENLSNFKQRVRQTGYSQMKHLIKDASISQISDTGGDQTKDLLELQSGPNPNSSQDVVSDSNQMQLTTGQLKQLKTQKNQLEVEFKKKFLIQLQAQLVKRIEQVKFQTNILEKQKNLFAIYGNTTNNISPEPNMRNFNNVSIETIQAGIDLDEMGSNQKKMIAFQNKYKTAAKAGENKMISRNESPTKLEGSHGYSVLKGSISRVQEPLLVKQNTNVSKFSRLSDSNNDIKEEDQQFQDEDDKEHRVTGMSYDFEQEASLKKLLSMSNSLGYSQVQVRELRQKQKELEEAEKKLQKQQISKSNDTYLNARNTGQNISGSFVVMNEGKQMKKSPKPVHTRAKTDKKPVVREKLTSIKEKESKIDENRSIDNEDNVKDYFDNKMSMRRSIEQKLHYESKISFNKAAGHNYPTSAQKHQQLLSDLKNLKKERAKAYNLNAKTNTQNTEVSSYDLIVPKKHQRFKTNVSMRNGPKGSYHDEKESTLPNIHAQNLRKQKSNVKESENQDPLDENFYPLKKSGTQNERNDVGFSPIRVKRNNVMMAFNANQIQSANPQNMAAQGQYNAESLMKGQNNSSKKQLGFQFMNKSPRPSIISNGLQKNSSFTYEKDSPQKYNSNNTSSSKFIQTKQVQLMKGVLSHPRKNRTIHNLKTKDLMHIHVNEASQGTLPQIHQSSSYAPGQ